MLQCGFEFGELSDRSTSILYGLVGLWADKNALNHSNIKQIEILVGRINCVVKLTLSAILEGK